MKKAASFLLALLLVFTVAISAFAEEFVSFGRVSVLMPEIYVELKGNGYQKKDISATLDNEKLTVVDVADYDSGKHTSRVYILVDLSTSMAGSFDLVKENIAKFINTLGRNDEIILITFGETEVKTVLSGSEDRNTALSVVKDLQCNEYGTVFYEALSRAYKMSESSSAHFDREYVITFSDGIDLQRGNTTFDEVSKQYQSHNLPLYAACCSNASQASADKFGAIARISGGDIAIIKDASDFDSFLATIRSVSIVKLAAATNYADGKEKQLSLKVGEYQKEINISVARSIPDEEAPTVERISYDPDKDLLVIAFSEKVNGADATNAYKITDNSGKTIEVSSVYYDEKSDTYEIRTKTAFNNGTYSVEFSGIKDISQEANPLDDRCSFDVSVPVPSESVAATPDEQTAENEDFPLWGIIIILAVILLLIGIGILFAVRSSKKRNEADVDNSVESILVRNPPEEYNYRSQNAQIKHHIVAEEAVRIRLRIKTGKTMEQTVETRVVSSLIVGRSDTCDIYIDDTKLSRQHFVIENDGGSTYVMDLQSRNGTMLNGVRINSRQKLRSGDKILAGLSDIIITILGR